MGNPVILLLSLLLTLSFSQIAPIQKNPNLIAQYSCVGLTCPTGLILQGCNCICPNPIPTCLPSQFYN